MPEWFFYERWELTAIYVMRPRTVPPRMWLSFVLDNDSKGRSCRRHIFSGVSLEVLGHDILPIHFLSCLGHHTWQKITVDWSSATHMCVCVCSCRIPCWWLFFHGSFESEKLTIGFAGLFFFFSSSSGETRCGWQCRCLSVVHIRRVNGSWCPDNG